MKQISLQVNDIPLRAKLTWFFYGACYCFAALSALLLYGVSQAIFVTVLTIVLFLLDGLISN